MRKLLLLLGFVLLIPLSAQAQSSQVKIALGSTYASGIVNVIPLYQAGQFTGVLTYSLGSSGNLVIYNLNQGQIAGVFVCEANGTGCLYTTVIPTGAVQDITSALQANPFGSGSSSGVSSFSGDGAFANNSGSTGAVTLTLANANADKVWGNCTGSSAAPGYCSIVAAMQPSTTVNSVTNDTNVTGSISTQALTLGWTGTLAVARGGIGVGTLTGIAKGNGTSAFTAAASTDVIGLWSGTCSSSTFLRGDGSCQTPSGSGNTTSTSLTTNTVPKANGANSIINSSISDNGTTVSTTEPLSVGTSISTTSSGGAAGYYLCPAGTAPGVGATSTITLSCPASVTAYEQLLPTAAATGIPHWSNSLNVVTTTVSAVVGSDMSNNTVTATQLAAQYSKLRCEPGLGDGLNAIPAGTYLQFTCYNDSGVTWTLTGFRCLTDNSGSSTMNATNGSGTGLLTGAITCSSSWATGTQSGTTTIASGDYIKFTFVADGTSKQTTWVVSMTQ